jgi:hypothetical protein
MCRYRSADRAVITTCHAADAASLEFFRSEEDPISQLLPVNSVLGAFILRGDMHTKADEWMLLEDLKKNDAN